jgi:hypothetical protein
VWLKVRVLPLEPTSKTLNFKEIWVAGRRIEGKWQPVGQLGAGFLVLCQDSD